MCMATAFYAGPCCVFHGPIHSSSQHGGLTHSRTHVLLANPLTGLTDGRPIRLCATLFRVLDPEDHTHSSKATLSRRTPTTLTSCSHAGQGCTFSSRSGTPTALRPSHAALDARHVDGVGKALPRGSLPFLCTHHRVRTDRGPCNRPPSHLVL
jgi:hypothetical protein